MYCIISKTEIVRMEEGGYKKNKGTKERLVGEIGNTCK